MMNPSLNKSNIGFTLTKKKTFTTKLNLVALMDIFTILVFFLLLNAGDSDRLENAKFIKLPDSSASAAPHVEALLTIDRESIWLNQVKVAELTDIQTADGKLNPVFSESINSALSEYKEKRGELSPYEKENGLSVTIMGDEQVSFSLLKSVMTLCSENDFREISLAVNRIASQDFLSASTSTSESGVSNANATTKATSVTTTTESGG